MKEIGGYFEFEELIKNEYHKNLLKFNTGRNALVYLIKSKKIEKIYIPYYLCESVYEILDKYECKYEFYRIARDFLPNFDKKLLENEYLYIVNYYGQISNKKLLKLKEKYKNIIIDNTHAFFQEPLEEIDTIYNCRKWFGVPDGAYLSSDIKMKQDLERDYSKDRMYYLFGRYEENASKYYTYFQENDKKFKNESIKTMSRLTENIMGAINYEKVRRVRQENYEYLCRSLKDINKLILDEVDIPFCYPLYLDNTEGVREYLAERKIYIPTLWPNVLKENFKESVEYKYAKNILPIPCDQRYRTEDMIFIVKNILKLI